MKIAHCPICRDMVTRLRLDGYPNVTLRHMRRAHTDHQHPRTKRVLIRNGRKA